MSEAQTVQAMTSSLFLNYCSPVVDVFADGIVDDHLSECFGIAMQSLKLLERSVVMAFAHLARNTKLSRQTPAPALKPRSKQRTNKSKRLT
jgi:hypothetical protein